MLDFRHQAPMAWGPEVEGGIFLWQHLKARETAGVVQGQLLARQIRLAMHETQHQISVQHPLIAHGTKCL